LIRLAVFQDSGNARVKLHLRRTAEYRISKGGIASGFAFGCDPTGRSVVLKKTVRQKSSRQAEYIPSTFDIHYSIFDIRFFKVSFAI